jgi:hypothetical protein
MPGVNPLALPLAVALSLGQGAPGPTPAPQPAGAAPAPAPRPALRELRLEPLPGGAFRATLDGQPVSGADLYRAALRPDLAERAETRAQRRTAALVAAGGALVGGPAIGWVAFRAQGRSVQACVLPGTGCEELNAQIRRDNRALERRGLLVGGAAGAAAAGLALWWWAAHPPLAPDLAEAEALVKAYEARRTGASPGGPGAAPAPKAGETGLQLRLLPLPGGLLASATWRG